MNLKPRTAPLPLPVRGARWIALTQGKFALVDACDFDLLVKSCWYTSKGRTGIYYAVQNKPPPKRGIVGMHQVILQTPLEVDHINGDGLDNRRKNLRPATKVEQQRNRQAPSSNTSGYKGVVRSRDKWQAQIRVGGKTLFLGRFETKIKAARAYDVAAQKHFGAFAKLNLNEGGGPTPAFSQTNGPNGEAKT